MSMLKELLLEIELEGTQKGVEQIFNNALMQVYSPNYLNKINNYIGIVRL